MAVGYQESLSKFQNYRIQAIDNDLAESMSKSTINNNPR